MLDGSAPPPAAPLEDMAAPRAVPGVPHRSSWIAIALLVVLLAGIAMLIFIVRGRNEETTPLLVSSPTAPATLAPSQPTQGEYQFLSIPWKASRGDVRASLGERGFSRLERDEDGDDQYQGRVEGRDAGVVAMFAGDKLAKVMVVMLAADSSGGVYDMATKNLKAAYGSPLRQQGAANVWPERNGSLVWVTTEADGHVKINFESPQWPAESRRRKGAK
jgi:hypothetical protein